MSIPPLTRETFIGPWAGLPVAWSDANRFDETTYRKDIAACCRVGMPGVYSGGTTGEFYAMEFDEFQAVAGTLVDECHAHDKPAMVGVSSTYTLGACRRAAFAAEIGADAIQVALPFWMEVPDSEVVGFFADVAEAFNNGPMSIYETTRAKKALTLEQHRAIYDAAPGYMMVKANANTIGRTEEGCRALSEFINVFVGENELGVLGRCGAVGACSSVVYWGPSVVLQQWELLKQKQWQPLDAICEKINALFSFLFETFGPRGFTDSGYDRLGGLSTGFLSTSLHCRKPYPHATAEDVKVLHDWIEANYPEMLRF